ncbi:unnamed protein product [Cyprideis torosa]|uniref:Uncharacterized protein n=1 Tax=Cyprideis torosa TaxID=163714 RepID=A0A7R8ZR54_9CRUS|nr:unnamed protein product [Cyprideis torosa]CAG0902880.1 unnamed protein product [Cyprideis torosa]
MSKYMVRLKNINPTLECDSLASLLDSYSLGFPGVEFSLKDLRTNTFQVQPLSSSILEKFSGISGIKASDMIKISYQKGQWELSGLISRKSDDSKSDLQFVFLNKRPILGRSRLHELFIRQLMNSSLIQSTSSCISKTYPVFLLFVNCPSRMFDITYEPRRTVVEFGNWELLAEHFRNLIRRTSEEMSGVVKPTGDEEGPTSHQIGLLGARTAVAGRPLAEALTPGEYRAREGRTATRKTATRKTTSTVVGDRSQQKTVVSASFKRFAFEKSAGAKTAEGAELSKSADEVQGEAPTGLSKEDKKKLLLFGSKGLLSFAALARSSPEESELASSSPSDGMTYPRMESHETAGGRGDDVSGPPKRARVAGDGDRSRSAEDTKTRSAPDYGRSRHPPQRDKSSSSPPSSGPPSDLFPVKPRVTETQEFLITRWTKRPLKRSAETRTPFEITRIDERVRIQDLSYGHRPPRSPRAAYRSARTHEVPSPRLSSDTMRDIQRSFTTQKSWRRETLYDRRKRLTGRFRTKSECNRELNQVRYRLEQLCREERREEVSQYDSSSHVPPTPVCLKLPSALCSITSPPTAPPCSPVKGFLISSSASSPMAMSSASSRLASHSPALSSSPDRQPQPPRFDGETTAPVTSDQSITASKTTEPAVAQTTWKTARQESVQTTGKLSETTVSRSMAQTTVHGSPQSESSSLHEPFPSPDTEEQRSRLQERESKELPDGGRVDETVREAVREEIHLAVEPSISTHMDVLGNQLGETGLGNLSAMDLSGTESSPAKAVGVADIDRSIVEPEKRVSREEVFRGDSILDQAVAEEKETTKESVKGEENEITTEEQLNEKNLGGLFEEAIISEVLGDLEEQSPTSIFGTGEGPSIQEVEKQWDAQNTAVPMDTSVLAGEQEELPSAMEHLVCQSGGEFMHSEPGGSEIQEREPQRAPGSPESHSSGAEAVEDHLAYIHGTMLPTLFNWSPNAGIPGTPQAEVVPKIQPDSSVQCPLGTGGIIDAARHNRLAPALLEMLLLMSTNGSVRGVARIFSGTSGSHLGEPGPRGPRG